MRHEHGFMTMSGLCTVVVRGDGEACGKSCYSRCSDCQAFVCHPHRSLHCCCQERELASATPTTGSECVEGNPANPFCIRYHWV